MCFKVTRMPFSHARRHSGIAVWMWDDLPVRGTSALASALAQPGMTPLPPEKELAHSATCFGGGWLRDYRSTIKSARKKYRELITIGGYKK